MTSIAARTLKHLNGVFCIYKPAGTTIHSVEASIKLNIISELNSMPCRPIKQRVIFPELSTNELVSTNQLSVQPDLSDHPLVVGERYIEDDLVLRFSAKMKREASGVLIVGINNCKKIINEIARKQYIRVYHIECELGVCTKDMWMTSDIRRRNTYDHVTSAKMDKSIAAMQSLEQKHIFKMAGVVDLQSERAYELARGGYIKPESASHGAVVYGIKCISMKAPRFTLEVHSIYESTVTLATLVENLGLILRTSAAVHSIRRIRYGPFQVDDAILRRYWSIQSIQENIARCAEILDQSQSLTSLPSGDFTLRSGESDKLLPSHDINNV